MTTVKHEVSIGFYEVVRVFFLQCVRVCVCVCVCVEGGKCSASRRGTPLIFPSRKNPARGTVEHVTLRHIAQKMIILLIFSHN